MVEKFLHTSDLLRVFLLFCLVKRISYSFPPCFLRCELLFISYISLQMHHVDLALAKNRLASSTQFTCLSKSENFYEFRHNRMHPDARMHISSRRLDALNESPSNEKERRLARCASTRHTFPHGSLYTNAADTFFGVSRIRALYTYICIASQTAVLRLS